MDAREQDRLIESHMPMVNRVVAQERRKLGADKTLTEEMHSFALEGLARALSDFDPKKGVAFQYYAQKRIRWSIYDGLREITWLPRSLHRQLSFYRKAHEMLSYAGERPTPEDKIAATHQLSDRLKELATAYITSYSADSENEPVSVPPEAETHLSNKETATDLRHLIETLPAKERTVVLQYFFRDQPLSAIGKELGLSSSWTSKILSSALKRIRRLVENNPELMHRLKEGRLSA